MIMSLFWDEDIGGAPSMEFRYSAKMKRYDISRKRLEGVHCKCAGWKPRRHCAGGSLAEETFYIKKSWVDLGKPIMNLTNEYAEREFQTASAANDKDLIGHNHDEENLVEARIWVSLQERNFRFAQWRQFTKFWEGQNLLWRGENVWCTVMPNASYQHPQLKSIIFMYLKVLKLSIHVHIEFLI